MNRTKWTIAALSLALVGSNAWWAYQAVDAGISLTYRNVALEDNQGALEQTLRLLPVVAHPGVSRAEVIAAARVPGQTDDSFEKDGFLWVDKIGLRFNEQGQLIEVSRAWSPP